MGTCLQGPYMRWIKSQFQVSQATSSGERFETVPY